MGYINSTHCEVLIINGVNVIQTVIRHIYQNDDGILTAVEGTSYLQYKRDC